MEIVSAYNVHPVKQKSLAKIKFLGRVKVGKGINLKDNIIKQIMIDDYVFCFFMKPTVTQAYIMGNTKLPVLYARIDYMKNMIRRPLMTLWLFFEADKDRYYKRTKFDSTIDGQYVLEGEIDGDFEEIERFDRFPTKGEIMGKMEDICRSDEAKESYKDMIDEINRKRVKEGEALNFPTEPPKITITKEELKKLQSSS